MSDAAITDDQKKADPTAGQTAATADKGSTVTLTKEEHDKLQAELKTAKDLQAQADKRASRLERMVGRKAVSPFAKSESNPVVPTKEELDEQGLVEDRKAEKGLLALALDPAFREVLDADPTLRQLLTSNPLGVLPILAPDALDAEDAIELVRDSLTNRLASIKKPTPPAADDKKAPPPTPPIGGGNPRSEAEVDADYEAAKKIPNTENSIAKMVKIGISKLGKK